MGWMKDLIDDGKDIGRYAGVPAYFNLIGFGNLHDMDNGNTILWQHNTKQNLKWLEKNSDRVIGSIDNMPQHENDAIIFVGMSPNIKKSWKYLKKLDPRFVIVASNSSAKYLLDRGIKPHYVVALDGRPGSWTLKLGDKAKDIIGLFSTTVDPNALKDWPGKVIVIPYHMGPKSINKKINEKYGPTFPGGGNAINGAVLVFAQKTKATIFMFVGNELSFRNKYYADRECKHDSEGKFYAKDVNGRKVKTLFPLWEYKVWLENLASNLHGNYWFCNCSEGILGVEVDGSRLPFIDQRSLPDAIAAVQDAWETEKLPIEERAKIIYDEAYKSGLYQPVNGPSMWESMRKAGIKFTKALDVGCGTGVGIKESRDAGYDVWGADIADGTYFWNKLGIGDYCVVAPAHSMPFKDDEFDFVVCAEVMEHIPEHMVDASLQEIRRVGSDEFYFAICLEPEKNPLMGVLQSHITVKSREWWIQKVRDNGFADIIYSDANMGEYSHVTIRAAKCRK